VSREGQAGPLPHRHALCGGVGAPRPHGWLWAVAALTFVIDDHLVLRNVPVPSPEELLGRRFPSPALYIASLVRFGPERLRLALSFGDLAETRAGRVTLHVLDAMRDAVLSRGAQFVLMLIPRPITAQGSDTERMLQRWGAATGTPVVNLRTAYLRLPPVERDRLYDGHWTPHGAHVTAGLLAAALRRG
jgi:hypothetical protein